MGNSEGPPVSGGTSLLYHDRGMDWELDRLGENARQNVFSMVDCDGCKNEI